MSTNTLITNTWLKQRYNCILYYISGIDGTSEKGNGFFFIYTDSNGCEVPM